MERGIKVMKKVGLKLAAVMASVAIAMTGTCGYMQAQEAEMVATVTKEILPEGDGWAEETDEESGQKFYRKDSDSIVTELEDTKVEAGVWYSIESEYLTILEFGSNGYFKETIIDLNRCTERQYIIPYTLEDSELMFWGRCFDYLEKSEELCLILQDEEYIDKTVLYNSFSLAQKNCEEYEQTTYAINKTADEEGFAIKDGILTGYIGNAETITIPKGVVKIAANAFSGEMGRSMNLKKVIIGNDVKTIDAEAFAYTRAEVIVMEEGVEQIGAYCFRNSSVKDIYIPESVTTIEYSPFNKGEAVDGIILHCVKDSYAAEHFEENRPYGRVRIVYDSEENITIGDTFYNTDITAADMQKKFPHGAFWNHITNETHDMTDYTDTGSCNAPDRYTWNECTSHGGGTYSDKVLPGVYHCNGFAGTTECYGFAAKLTSEIYGYENGCFDWPETWLRTEWDEYDGLADYEIKPGDVVYFEGAGAGVYGHRGMVIDVDGTKVRLAECNWGKRCQISWGRWMDLEDTSFCMIHVAPYALPDGGEDVITDFKKGDLNKSGTRELNDAQECLKGALHIGNMDEDTACRADMDGDGTVTLQDAQFLLKVALMITKIE